ncbi:MAG: hypothetical protein HC828_03330 [Blastochloris sp.]|nr:hypothetical protein [Blastochloris sp.]
MSAFITWARVIYERQAYAVREAMTEEERERIDRVIEVIKNAPEDGSHYANASDGTILRQMTGGNIHVIYVVKHWAIGRVLGITTIEIRDWEPLDTGDVQGATKKRRR